MFSIELWLGLILIALMTLFTAINVAIRQFSRVQLSELLERKGKEHLLDAFTVHREELIFDSAIIRTAAILGLVLLITHLVGIRPESDATAFYALVFIVASLVIMLAGVTLPSALARYGGTSLLAGTLPMMLLIRRLMVPLVGFQHLMNGLVRRLAGIPKTDEKEAEANEIEKEILDAVSEGELVGAVHEDDAEMIESVMEFRETDVAEIMTPRTEMSALPATSTLTEAKDFIAAEGHSRIPVFEENLDDIKGVLYAKDLLQCRDDESFDPRAVMRKVPFVPETKHIADLLTEMRDSAVHLAIVVDEYGGTAGLVTIEDIVEEVFGEIADEYETPEPEPIHRISPQLIEVDARVHIDELNEELDIKLPEDKDYDTVGGFLFSEMGKVPQAGEELCYENVRFHVIDAEDRKINRLRVEVLTDKQVST